MTNRLFGNLSMGIAPFHLVLVLSLFTFLLFGCQNSSTPETIYTVVQEATLTAGNEIPEPESELVLTVLGKIGITNSDASIVMDTPTIEAVGVVEYDVHDPFEDRSIVYSGVLMSDLLKVWQVPDEVEMVRVTALNDYQIEIPISDFYTYPVLLALQADGDYMQPNYRGPAMLVYPMDDFELDPISIKRRWIWQIKTIELQ